MTKNLTIIKKKKYGDNLLQLLLKCIVLEMTKSDFYDDYKNKFKNLFNLN